MTTSPAAAAAASSPSPGDTWRYRPELDGLRAFAVVVIVFFHAQVAGASSSFIVLDLFFVLSGFLVTNVVLQEIDRHGQFRLGRYYARRVRRLLPAAVVTIVATSVLFLLVAAEPQRAEFVRHAQAALVYLANWQFIADGADYFAGDIRDSPFMHFWSLSVEEQYYIFFPLLILAWLKFAPGRSRVLLGIFGVGIALSLASQVYWGQVLPTRAYFATDARLFQLLAGAALAVVLREFATAAPGGGIRWSRAGRVLAAAGLLGYAVFGTELVSMSVSNRNILATFIAGSLVLGVYAAPDSLVARFFALPWLVYLGKISYGIYLWHYPAVVALERLFVVSPLVIALMAIVIAVAMASMSYELLETPIRRGTFLDGFHWKTVGVGVALSVLAAVAVVPPVLTSSRTPAVASAAQPEAELAAEAAAKSEKAKEVKKKIQKPVPRSIDLEQVANDRGPSWPTCIADDPDRCVVVDGEGPHVVLVGDSHARSLGPTMATLAEEHGFRFSSHVVPACPWPDGVVNQRASKDRREQCREAMSNFYDKTVPAIGADVVVLANLPRTGEMWEEHVTDRAGREVKLHRYTRDAVERTTRKIDRAGAETVIVKSMMGTNGWSVEGPDPLECLARAERQVECVVTPPQDRAVVDSFYQEVAVRRDSVEAIDLNPMICPAHPVCRSVIDGQPVWRNADHVAASYFEKHRGQLWELLQESGSAF